MPGQPEQIGPYKIVSELGHGGMGVVYKAFDPELERYVAVKCLAERFANDESVATRFLREARSVAPLSHPNIVPVYTAGREGGQPYFVMEHVDGETLTERLQREHALPIAEAARIVLAAAAGLQAAHEAGVTHRDIKPSNLLLDRDGRVRIADFGIARIEGVTKLTQTGGLIGTPGYISPEAIEGEADDHRSDIFSLGVVFYEMLTGQMPFPQASPVQMWRAAVEAKYPDVRELNAEVDDHTLAVLRRMLAADPKDRYQTCNELIEDVQPIAAESIAATAERPNRQAGVATATPTAPTAKGAPATQPTQQAHRGRRYTGVAVGVALIALAAVATGLLTWFSDRPPGEGAIAALTDSEDSAEAQSGETERADAAGDDRAPAAHDPASPNGDDTGSSDSGADSGKLAASEHDPDDAQARGGEASTPASKAVSSDAESSGDIAATDETSTMGDPSSPSDSTSAQPEPVAAHDGEESSAADDDAGEKVAATASTTSDDDATKPGDSRADQRPETTSKSQPAEEEQATPVPAKTVASASARPAGSQPAYRDGDDTARSDEARGSEDSEPTVVAKVTKDPSTGASSAKKQQQPPPPPPADKVAVLAAGDSAVARPLETALENALRRDGHDLVNERFVSGANQHIGNRGVNLAPLRELLRAEGVGVLVVARIVPIGQRQLQYRGRRSTAYSSQVDLTVYDLTDGSRIDGWQNQFEFTSLNATEKARAAIEPYLGRLTAQLAAYGG